MLRLTRPQNQADYEPQSAAILDLPFRYPPIIEDFFRRTATLPEIEKGYVVSTDGQLIVRKMKPCLWRLIKETAGLPVAVRGWWDSTGSDIRFNMPLRPIITSAAMKDLGSQASSMNNRQDPEAQHRAALTERVRAIDDGMAYNSRSWERTTSCTEAGFDEEVTEDYWSMRVRRLAPYAPNDR